jgi:PIN domain nuclease of toxin-antitoxin system
MTMIHVIDTHALIWFLQNDPRLGAHATAIMSDPSATFVLPAIVLAEACRIVENGKTFIPSPQAILNAVAADARFTVAPLDISIIARTHEPDLRRVTEMHDHQIVATAVRLIERGEDISLVTRDENIAQSKLVPIIW